MAEPAGGPAAALHLVPNPEFGAPSTPVVWLAGELDANAVERVRERLHSLSRRFPVGPLQLNLSRVVFLDVAGVHLLLELEQQLARDNRVLRLIDASACVNVVLAICGCADVFVVVTSRRPTPASGFPPAFRRLRHAPISGAGEVVVAARPRQGR